MKNELARHFDVGEIWEYTFNGPEKKKSLKRALNDLIRERAAFLALKVSPGDWCHVEKADRDGLFFFVVNNDGNSALQEVNETSDVFRMTVFEFLDYYGTTERAKITIV